jgi:hypothetical protein
MKRREFFEKAGLGSAALVSIPVLGRPDKRATAQGKKDTQSSGEQEQEHGHEQDHGHDNDHDHDDDDAPATHTVSFGQWDLTTPLDRFPNKSDRTRNNHHLIPGKITINAGDAVNFLISGFHLVLVYGDGTQPADINRSLTINVTVPLAPPPAPPGPPLIDDPTNRIYRGLDPSVFPMLPGGTNPPMPLQDRVEVVRFPNPGKYLVICGVLPHFFDPATGQFIMFGFVKVRH